MKKMEKIPKDRLQQEWLIVIGLHLFVYKSLSAKVR